MRWTNAAGYTATASASGKTDVPVTLSTAPANPEASFTGLEMNTAYTVTVTATGDANYANSDASDGLSVTTLANQAPTVANEIPDQAATVDTAFEYIFPANSFSDADSDSLTYEAKQTDGTTDTALPSWLAFTATERKLAGTPKTANIGTLMVKVTASDGNGGSVSDTFNIVVSAANSAPTVGATIPDQAAVVGQSFSYTFPANTFRDADDDDLSYTATKPDDTALPSWLTFTNTSSKPRDFAGTPQSTDAGTLMVKVTASDGTASVSDTFDIVVSADTAPAFAGGTTIPDQTWTVDTEITAVTLPAATGGNGTVSYTLSPALPTGVSLNGTTRVVSGTPTVAAAQATYTWRAKDSDGNTANSDTAALTFSVTVNKAKLGKPTNLALKANSKTRTGFTVTFDAVDNAAGYTATASASGKTDVPVTLSTAPANPEASFTGLEMNTAYTVTVTATGDANYANSDASDGLSVTTLANQVPTVANEIPDQAATVDTAFEYIFPANSFSDADSDSLTYEAKQTDGTTDTALPSWLAFTATERKLAGTPKTANIGTLMVKVTASDGNGGSVSDTFNIVVSAANSAPTVGATIPDQAAVVGQSFSYTFPANTFSDADDDDLSYTATKPDDTALPSWLTFTNTSSKPRDFAGTPQSTDAGTLMVKVTASDGTASVSDTFDIVVSADTAPAFAGGTSIPAQSWTVDTEITAVTLPAATGGNGTVSYTLSPALPTGVSLNGTTRVVSGTPTVAAAQATYTWRAKDSDGNTADTDTAALTFSLTVNKAKLGKPTNLALKANSKTRTGFTVTFDAVDNAVGYTATAALGDAAVTGTVDTNGSSPEASFTGLTMNTAYTVTVTATGDANYANSDASDGLSVTTLANQAPTVANEIPDQAATVDTAFEYIFPANSFSDADSDSLTYEAKQTDGTTDTALPSWLAFTATERKLAGTPKTANIGTLMVKVTASDGNGGSISDTFNIVVSAANSAPTVGATIPDQAAVVGQSFSYTFPANTFRDADDDDLSYTATKSDDTALPSWLTFTNTSSKPRDFAGTPQSTDTGTLMVKVTASDGTASVSDTFDIVVSADTAPAFAGGTTIPAQTWTVDTEITALTLPAATGGNGTVSYTLSPALPTGVSLNGTTRVVSGTPTVAAAQATYTWRAKDSDGNTADTDTAALTFSLTVNKAKLGKPTNLALKANSKTRTGFTVTFDAVDNAVGYTATAALGDATVTGTVDTNGSSPEASFTGLTMNTAYTVTVTATGDANYANSDASDGLSVTTLANQVPTVANEIPDQAATVDTAFEYIFPANSFSDADSDSLTYEAKQTDGTTDTALPSWLAFTATERKLAGTPQSGDTGTLMVKVTASDGNGGSVSDTFNIVVSAANSAPTVGATIPDQAAVVGQSFSYTFPANTFRDADDDDLSYTATKPDDTALPSWLTFTNTSSKPRDFAGTPQSTDTGTLMVKVTASDGNGGSVSDTFDIEVSTAATPSLTYPALPTILRAGVQFETLTPSAPANFAAGSTFSYAVTDGTLPSGLEISATTGAISGTPDTPKATRESVTVTVTGTTGAGEAKQTQTATATLDFPRIFRFKLPAPTVTLAVDDTQLTANWDAVANAASYELQWKASTTSSWEAETGVTTVDPVTSGTAITGLTNGTEYDVRVRAKAASDSTTHEDSAWSEVKKGTPVVEDVAPAFAVGTTIPTQTWTVGVAVDVTLPAATGGNGTISYELTPALPNGVTVDTSTRKVSGTPDAVASAATHTWRAKDSDANTADSDTASLTFSVTVGKGTLATPENLALKANTQSRTGFTVTWDAVDNATSYTATATPSGGSAVSGTVDTTGDRPQASFTGLTVDTEYTVSVTATGNANYNDSAAKTLSQATAANAAPSITAIGNQEVTYGAPALALDVGATDTNAEDTLQYRAASNDENVATVAPTSLTDLESTSKVTVTFVGAGTATITVTVSDGTATRTETFTVEVSRATLATPVVTLDAGDTELTPSWADVANAASYELQWKATSTASWDGTGVTTVDPATSGTAITGLTNGQAYDVRVRAKASAGSTTHEDGAWSSGVQGTPVEADVAPAFGSETIPDQIWTVDTPVSLTLPAATGGNGTLSYTLTPTLPAGVSVNPSTRVVRGTPTAATSSATIYTWRAADSDANTAGSDTAALTFGVAVSRAMLSPPSVTLTAQDARLTATWANVANAVSYEVEYRESGADAWMDGSDDTSPAEIAGLTNDTEYEVRVRAKAAPGSMVHADSAWSVVVKDTPEAPAEQARKEWVAQFGHSTTELALGGVTQRLVAVRTPGTRVVLAGQPLDGGGWSDAGAERLFSDPSAALGRAGEAGVNAGERTMTVGEALAASSFTMTGEADETGAGYALWGQVMQSHFDARTDEGADLDGKVTTGLLGADYGDESWLAGLALAWSDSEGGYGGAESSGDVEASLGAVVPYASLRATEGVDVWGAVGYGSGTLRLTPGGEAAVETDIDWRMVSAGVRGELLGLESGPELALVSDALWSRTGSSRVEASGARTGLAASESDATRLRLGVEGRWNMRLEEGGSFAPRLEAGVRHDDGDVGRGFGVELGGGVAWAVPRLGLSLDVAGRTLLAHESGGRRERGYSATVGYDARPGSEQGLSLSVRRKTGGRSEGGLDALFASEPLDERTVGEAEGGWSAEAAYGLPVFGGRFTASPTVGVGIVGESRDYSLGWRLAPASESDAPELSLGVEATRGSAVRRRLSTVSGWSSACAGEGGALRAGAAAIGGADSVPSAGCAWLTSHWTRPWVDRPGGSNDDRPAWRTTARNRSRPTARPPARRSSGPPRRHHAPSRRQGSSEPDHRSQESSHEEADWQTDGAAACRGVSLRRIGRRPGGIHLGAGEEQRRAQVRRVQLSPLLRQGQGHQRVGRLSRGDGEGRGQGDEGRPRDGRGRRLERAGARDLDREGRHGGGDAGDPGAGDRHRLRGADLLDRVGDRESAGVRGQGLVGLQQPGRQGRGDDRHLRSAPAGEVGPEGDAGPVQGALPDHPRRVVGTGRRVHHHGALEHDRQGEEPRARHVQQSEAARRPAGLLRYPVGSRLHLQELPRLVGGVEQPARPQRAAHEGGDAEVQRHLRDPRHGFLLAVARDPDRGRGFAAPGTRRPRGFPWTAPQGGSASLGPGTVPAARARQPASVRTPDGERPSEGIRVAGVKQSVLATVTCLEMTSASRRSAAPGWAEPVTHRRTERPAVSFYRYLPDTVGRTGTGTSGGGSRTTRSPRSFTTTRWRCTNIQPGRLQWPHGDGTSRRTARCTPARSST